jgi:hypothetical protein
MSVVLIRLRPPSYFTHVPIATPVVSALKNYYIQSFLELPTDFFKALLDPGNRFASETAARRTAVSEVKRQLRRRFGSETVTNLHRLYIVYVTAIPQRTQVSVWV